MIDQPTVKSSMAISLEPQNTIVWRLIGAMNNVMPATKKDAGFH